jgi:hypothetical protein
VRVVINKVLQFSICEIPKTDRTFYYGNRVFFMQPS